MSSARPAAQTVDDALTLLEAVATTRGATLTELARATGMTTSKAYRLLGTLEERGYLERRSGKTFELGPKLLHLGHRAARGHPLMRAAAPALDRLARASGESALLAVRVGLERVIVDTRDSQFGPQLAWPFDARLPLHSGALGICLLAYAPSDVIHRVRRGDLPAFTEHTVASDVDLDRALIMVRKDHVYVAKHSYVSGVYSVASPIVGADRGDVAALAVVGAVSRLDPATEERLRTDVRDAAAEVGRYLT